MARYLVTLLMDVSDDSHPRKFVPDCMNEALKDGEDLIDYNFVALSGDEVLVDKKSGTIVSPEHCVIMSGSHLDDDEDYSDSEIIDIADEHGIPVVPEG